MGPKKGKKAPEVQKLTPLDEIALEEANARKYRELWRETVTQIKMPSIVQNAEVTRRCFDRALDIKDFRVGLLMDAIDQADEQRRVNSQHHGQLIDRQFERHQTDMTKKLQMYENKILNTLDTAGEEMDYIDEEYYDNEIFMKNIIRNMERHIHNITTEIGGHSISKVDAFIKECENSRRETIAQLERKLEIIWENLKKVLRDYQDNTRERRKAYDIVKEKDEKDRCMIAQQSKRMATLNESIRKFREKIVAFTSKTEDEIFDVTNENNALGEAYRLAKHRFFTEEKTDETGITTMSVTCNRTLNSLKGLMKKGERILLLMRSCRKYETQDEKILPFVAPIKFKDSRSRIMSHEAFAIPQEVIDEYGRLENFSRRLGATSVITMELRLERDLLKSELNQLKCLLRNNLSEKYTDGAAYTQKYVKEV